jgi:hypothetical protein
MSGMSMMQRLLIGLVKRLPAAAVALAGLGLPLRAHLLALCAAGAGAARRGHGQLPDAAPAGALPPLVRGGCDPVPAERPRLFSHLSDHPSKPS